MIVRKLRVTRRAYLTLPNDAREVFKAWLADHGLATGFELTGAPVTDDGLDIDLEPEGGSITCDVYTLPITGSKARVQRSLKRPIPKVVMDALGLTCPT